MKFGVRKVSIKKSFSARTTGKVKRKIKKLANPFYGKKGMGWIRNPKKAAYNKIYNKTSISTKNAVKKSGGCLWDCIYYPCYWCIILMWWMLKYTFLGMWWLCVLMINGIISLINILTNWTLPAEETDEVEE